MNYADIITKKCSPGDEADEFARIIVHESERIAIIIKNLLTFSRQEKQTHDLAAIKDIVDSTLSLIGKILSKDQIAIKVEIQDNLGTGLGLSISHSLVKDHQGNIIVESELGQYTKFHIDIPIAETPIS